MSAPAIAPTHYVIVGASLGVCLGFMLQSVELVLAALTVWLALTSELVWRRMREAWLEPVAVSETIGTTMLRPFIAVFGRHFVRR